jgi:hypothetical protein
MTMKTISTKTGKHVSGLIMLVLLGLAMEQPAAAYTDPGTGALIWQMVAAGFVGVMFYFRRITSYFTRFRNKDPKE